MFTLNSFHLFFAVIAVIKIVKSQSDADQDRVNKIIACINLNKAMLHYDDSYVDKVMKYVENQDKTQVVDEFSKKSILNCFAKISMTKTAEFAKKKKYENANPFAEDNKAILNMNNFKERYGENADLLKKDMEKLFSLQKYIPMEITSFEIMIDEKIKQRQANLEKSEKERLERVAEDERKRKAYQEKIDQTDETAQLGEINLSFFKRLSKSSQFLIAFGLIAAIFSGIYLCIFALNKKEKVQKKKNKQ